MHDMSRSTRQKTWQGQPRRVSVLAEMALRQEKVSERLLELRERHGLSQEDAARKVGITYRQWQRWEHGESMPYPRSLDMVASAFQISVADFFDEPAQATVVDETQLESVERRLARIEGLLTCIAEALPAPSKAKAATLRTFLDGELGDLFRTPSPSGR